MKAPAWFALTVKPRHEKAAAEHLRLRGFEEFLPVQRVRRSWSDRVQAVEMPLFPGYVFCRYSYPDRLRALNTPGVKSVVSFGAVEIPLDDVEIASLRALIASGLPVTPWPYLKIGDTVEIERGALNGVRGVIVREKSPWRLVVSIELLQRSVAVEVDRELLGPCRGFSPTPTCQQQPSC